MDNMSLSQYKYAKESGSVNGGSLAWLTVLESGNGFEIIQETGTCKVYRAVFCGNTVDIIPCVGKWKKRLQHNNDLFNKGQTVKQESFRDILNDSIKV